MNVQRNLCFLGRLITTSLSLALLGGFFCADAASCQNVSSTAAGNLTAVASSALPWYPFTPHISPPSPPTHTAVTQSWMIIPDWLAGTWEARSEMLMAGYDYKKQCKIVEAPVRIPVKRTSVLGTQRDSQGEIWHYCGTPYRRVIETDQFTEVQIVRQLLVQYSGQDELSINTVATVQRLDPKTRELLDAFAERSKTTYLPLQDGLIQVHFLIDDFDMQGNPLYSSKIFCTQMRVKQFSPVQQDERGDLRAMFRDFLITKGKNELVPQDNGLQLFVPRDSGL